MLIKLKRGWEMRESEATPEQVFLDRRRIVQAMGMGALIAATGGFAASAGAAAPPPDPSAGLYPVKRNDKYTLDRPITDEKLSTHYNNFYEFTEDKDVDADALPIRPWTVQIDGMVEKPMTHRHRRPVEADAARGAALSSPLRRGVVDGGAVERLPAEGFRGAREPARQRQIRALRELPECRRSRRDSASSGIRGPTSKG